MLVSQLSFRQSLGVMSMNQFELAGYLPGGGWKKEI
jgi:hypothetical protein